MTENDDQRIHAWICEISSGTALRSLKATSFWPWREEITVDDGYMRHRQRVISNRSRRAARNDMGSGFGGRKRFNALKANS
jgi:hypothetical protein